MTLNILFITVFIAVLINYICCVVQFEFYVCKDDKDVFNYLKTYQNGIVPLTIIRDENNNPFDDQTLKDDVKNFYKSQNVLRLLVVPADKCVATNNYINGGRYTRYPSLFMVTNGVLSSNRITEISANRISEFYDDVAQAYNSIEGSGLNFVDSLNAEIDRFETNRRTNNQTVRTVPTPGPLTTTLRAGNRGRKQPTVSIVPRGTQRATSWMVNNYWYAQPGSIATGRPAAINPVSAAAAEQNSTRSAFKPVPTANTRNSTTVKAGAVVPTRPATEFDLRRFLEDQRHIIYGSAATLRGNTQSVVRTGESGPGPSNTARRNEELVTRDLLSTMGGGQLHESSSYPTTHMQSNRFGYIPPANDGKRMKSESSSGGSSVSSSGPRTRR